MKCQRGAFFTSYAILFSFLLITFSALWIRPIVKLQESSYKRGEELKRYYLAEAGLQWFRAHWRDWDFRSKPVSQRRVRLRGEDRAIGFLCEVKLEKTEKSKYYSIRIFSILDTVSPEPEIQAIFQPKGQDLLWIHWKLLKKD